ncbi:hypothetical protein PAPYR_8345 [Paratrimastix pyriformis]|uniref:Tesmin/TSO1-like CXC domain-containing protein n=1 Tax=Paratrimastix pyriformis TaxID=342808 RepID=A0ABQ8UAW4_9EUKA|nr:hypothetical protein PAPYR_8345 [Paratrimastix pyriformis]
MARTGELLPKFVEDTLLGLLAQSDSCVHLRDSPPINSTLRDVTGKHMTTTGILLSPQIRDLFAFFSDLFAPITTPSGPAAIIGWTVFLRGPPYSGKSQALKILAAALQLKWPDQRVYYFREEPSLPRDFPENSIVIVDQVQPSHIRTIRTLIQGGVGLRLVASSSTGANYDPSSHSRQDNRVMADFNPDVGLTAFAYYLRLLGPPLAEPSVTSLYHYVGGSLFAAACLLGMQEPPASVSIQFPRKAHAPSDDIPLPGEIDSPTYPGAQRFVQFLLADMMAVLKQYSFRLLYLLYSMFIKGSSEIEVSHTQSVDLRWFMLDSDDTTLRIISPLHRYVMQYAYNKTRPGPLLPPDYGQLTEAEQGYTRERLVRDSPVQLTRQLCSVMPPFAPASLAQKEFLFQPGEDLDPHIRRVKERPALLIFRPCDPRHPRVDMIRVVLLEREAYLVGDQITVSKIGNHVDSLRWYLEEEWARLTGIVTSLYSGMGAEAAATATTTTPIPATPATAASVSVLAPPPMVVHQVFVFNSDQSCSRLTLPDDVSQAVDRLGVRVYCGLITSIIRENDNPTLVEIELNSTAELPKTCGCKKTRCKDNYCRCYKARRPCSSADGVGCTCLSCENPNGPRPVPEEGPRKPAAAPKDPTKDKEEEESSEGPEKMAQDDD